MSAFRRRKPQFDGHFDEHVDGGFEGQFDTAPTPPPISEPAPAAEPAAPVVEVRVPAHLERAMIAMSTQMHKCLERLDKLDARLDDLADQTMNIPSHGDVLEVRLHSAKLAAEMARVTVELRGEIGMASDEARRQARMTRTAEIMEPTITTADATLEIVDITEEEDQGGHAGWSASA